MSAGIRRMSSLRIHANAASASVRMSEPPGGAWINCGADLGKQARSQTARRDEARVAVPWACRSRYSIQCRSGETVASCRNGMRTPGLTYTRRPKCLLPPHVRCARS